MRTVTSSQAKEHEKKKKNDVIDIHIISICMYYSIFVIQGILGAMHCASQFLNFRCREK